MMRDRQTAFAVALAFLWAVLVVFVNWDKWAIDATALYMAGKSYAAGMTDLLYDGTPLTFYIDAPAQWVEWSVVGDWDHQDYTPFLYPPLWAALLSPIAGAMTITTFFKIILILDAASAVAIMFLTYALVRPKRLTILHWVMGGIVAVAVSAAGYMIFELGQPQIIVYALVIWAFVAMTRDRDYSAGALLALAAAIKLTPLIFAVIFIMERRWRALGAFAVTGAAFAVLSILLTGWPMHAAFLTKLHMVESHTLFAPILISLELGLMQISEMIQGIAAVDFTIPRSVPEPAWVEWTVRAAFLAGIILTYLSTRRLAEPPRVWIRLVLMVLIATLTNPLGWVHYMLLPVMFLPALFEILTKRAAILSIIAIAVPFSYFVLIRLLPGPSNDIYLIALNLAATFGYIALLLTRAATLGRAQT